MREIEHVEDIMLIEEYDEQEDQCMYEYDFDY